MSLENTILSGLIDNTTFLWKAIPFLKNEYFHSLDQRTTFDLINSYVEKYGHAPKKQALLIDLDKIDGMSEELYGRVQNTINSLDIKVEDVEWLVDTTEEFCKTKALHNAIRSAILILDGKDKDTERGAIPSILSDALGVSFDTDIGHDYFEDAEARHDFYHRIEERIPFDLDFFNLITRGGIPKKSLTVVLAGTGVGKSLFMCHCAATNLIAGKNVLYITLEMSEEKIAERIDANLLDVTIDDLNLLPKDVHKKKVDRVKGRTSGRLKIKEYPTSQAGAGHFRHLLRELAQKKEFVPDIVYIDYINICSSSRIKNNGNVNSYTYIKSIAEEIRGIAMEFDIPIVTATQTTRGGFDNSDIGLTDTSESFGLPATADLMFALIATEELAALDQILVKQLKNRYNGIDKYKRFVIGNQKNKMRLYNVEQVAQNDIMGEDKPLMDASPFGKRMAAEKGFSDFK